MYSVCMRRRRLFFQSGLRATLRASLLLLLLLGIGSPAYAEQHTITFTGPVIPPGGQVQAAAGDERLVRTIPGSGDEAPSVLPPDLLPPGSLPFNPSFEEGGLVVEAFWAVRVGEPGGHFITGHFHPKDLATGFEAQHFGNPRELHGLFIRARDGRLFSLKSLRYRVTRNRELGKDRTIDGFNTLDVKVLVSTSFTPTRPAVSQFVPFSVGTPIGNDTELPFETLQVYGFELVSRVFITSSGSVDFDDIVVETY